MSPVLSSFQSPNFTQVLLQPSSTRFVTQTTPTINELVIARLSANNHSLDLEKKLPHRTKRKDCFLDRFVHRRTAAAHPEPTKPETAALPAPFGCTTPTSHCPTLSAEVERTLQEVTSRDESLMPDIDGYIRERVNPSLFRLGLA